MAGNAIFIYCSAWYFVATPVRKMSHKTLGLFERRQSEKWFLSPKSRSFSSRDKTPLFSLGNASDVDRKCTAGRIPEFGSGSGQVWPWLKALTHSHSSRRQDCELTMILQELPVTSPRSNVIGFNLCFSFGCWDCEVDIRYGCQVGRYKTTKTGGLGSDSGMHAQG